MGEHIKLQNYRKSTNLLAEFGLIRFGFSESITTFFSEEVFDLIGENDRENRKFQNLMVGVLLKGVDDISKESRRISFIELEKIISLLWVFERYRLIIEIVDELQHLLVKSFKIKSVYIASLIKHGNVPDSKIKHHIGRLEMLEFDRKYQLQIVQSYLIFNLWDSYLDDSEQIPELVSNMNVSPYTLRSLELLRKAILWLGSERLKDKDFVFVRNTAYSYALNNYLYYVTRIGDTIQFKKLDKFYRTLLSLKVKRSSDNYWQNRFSETIALYLTRLAILRWSDIEFRNEQLLQAKKLTTEAKNKSAIDSCRYDVTLALINIAIKDPLAVEVLINKRNKT